MKTTKEGFKNLCKMMKIIASIVSIFMIVGASMLLINAIWLLTIGNTSVQIGSTSIYPPLISTGNEQFAVQIQIIYLIMMVTLFLVCVFAKKIFASLEKSETPFIAGLSGKIFGIGLTLMIGTGASIIFRTVADIAAGFYNPDANTDCLYVGFDGSTMLIGVFLLALSYIFEHGYKLQQESDETL